MRWEYREPEKKTFVSDGKTFYFYVPADRQVIVREQAGQRGIPALLLSGRGEILRRTSTVDPGAAPAPGRAAAAPDAAEGRPRGRARSSSTWTQGDRIRAIEVVDAQGNRSRFEFDEHPRERGPQGPLFEFEVPPGVEVIAG